MPKSADTPNGKTDGRNQLRASDIPDSVAKDFDSPDARVRLQALDSMTKRGTTASLDLLFAALEDEDEAVRVKATEIVEAHWAVEQERERK